MVNCDRTERQQQRDMCFTPVLVITSWKHPDVAYRWTIKVFTSGTGQENAQNIELLIKCNF